MRTTNKSAASALGISVSTVGTHLRAVFAKLEVQSRVQLANTKGAGLNRSELRTRQGHSPSVTFPRVLGIECVGIVAASTDPNVPEGTTVAAVMGEMGREFDGGYAEYALLPNELLMPITTTLPWDVLAALPETYLTAQGALDALHLKPGSRLLIRGGTSSVGLAAASIASGFGIETAATTRQPSKAATLTAAGVDHVLVDGRTSVDEIWPDGPDYILDLVGASTALDSLHLVRQGGAVCIAGSLSGWLIPNFEPIAMIPSGTTLTATTATPPKAPPRNSSKSSTTSSQAATTPTSTAPSPSPTSPRPTTT